MEISAQYKVFLRANYPDIAGKIEMLENQAPEGKNPEELQKSVSDIEVRLKTLANDSERLSRYHNWEKVPQVIRDNFNGRVPDDILEAAAHDEIYTLRILEYHPEIKRAQDARELAQQYQEKMPSEFINTAAAGVFVVAMAAGYSESASTELGQQRLHRDNLLNKKAGILADDRLSDAERKKLLDDWFKDWIASRESTAATIKKDWAENQPEKLLIHLLGRFNGGKIDKETLLPQLADFLQKIENSGRQNKLLEYMQTAKIQAKIGHFKDETRDILASLVLRNVPEAKREQYLARDFQKIAKNRANPDQNERFPDMQNTLKRNMQRERED